MKYIVYGQEGCSYCTLAVSLLESIGAEFAYTDLSEDQQANTMLKLAGHKKVPQIFKIPFEGAERVHVGGYTELAHEVSRYENQKGT